MTQRRRLSNTLSGVAGEYFVAAELSRRGYIASITLRNTRGIDILASRHDASHSVGIQVKTNQRSGKRWMLSKKVESSSEDGLFYVFVNLNGLDGAPAFHVVPSKVVADYCRIGHAEWLRTPGRGGRMHKDTDIRSFQDPDDEWKDRWDLLGID